MTLYPDHSRDEQEAWRAKKCASCNAGGAYLYCHVCRQELCSTCRNEHHVKHAREQRTS